MGNTGEYGSSWPNSGGLFIPFPWITELLHGSGEDVESTIS